MNIFDELSKSAFEFLVQTGTQQYRDFLYANLMHGCTYELTKPQGQWTAEECAATAARQAADRTLTCISCGSETQPCCGH